MGEAEITSGTAWIAALLLGGQALVGLLQVRLLRRTRDPRSPLINPLWAAHALIGLGLPALILMHAWFSMRLPGIRAANFRWGCGSRQQPCCWSLCKPRSAC